MLPYKRSERVAQLIKKEISEYLAERVTDPSVGFFTITDVVLSDDLKHARIYVSVLDDEKRERTIEVLRSMRGHIRTNVLMGLRMKNIPSIDFFHDSSVAYGDKMERLLKKIKEEDSTR